MKTYEILGRENYSAKERALNIISYQEYYTKEEIKEVYLRLQEDKRLSIETRNEILNKLRRIYKNK